MPVSFEARPAPAKAMPVSIPHEHERAKAMAVSDKLAIWPTGPRCDTHGRRQGLAGQRVDAQSTHQRPSAAGVEGAGGTGGPGCGARGQQGLARQHTDTPTDWRPPRGLRGLAGLRADAPSEARGADGERAGRPRGGRRSVGATSTPHTPSRHNKTARPQWGRAAVAVALGFEPRVAVTPHSISSAAPSAARTRYLTRILYYTLPPSAQIDRAGWEQGHTAVRKQSHTAVRKRGHSTTQNQGHTTPRDHTAAHETGTTSTFRTIENEIK